MVSGFPVGGSSLNGHSGSVLDLSERTSAEGLPEPILLSIGKIRERSEAIDVGGWSPWFRVRIQRKEQPLEAQARLKRLDGDRIWSTPLYRTESPAQVTSPPSFQQRLGADLGRPYIPEGVGFRKWRLPETAEVSLDHLIDISRLQTRAAEMALAGDWHLFIYVHTLIDRASHIYWPFFRPDGYPVDDTRLERFGDSLVEAYRESDRHLGALLAATENTEVPTWALVISDHGFQSGPRKGVHGIHDFDGIYMLAGPGIVPGPGPRQMIEDVMPTMLYLLGLPAARDMVGESFSALGEPVGEPLAPIDSYESGDVTTPAEPEIDDEALEQLRSLGYLDSDG